MSHLISTRAARRGLIPHTVVAVLVLAVAPPRQAAAQAERIVTFITGDRVVVGGPNADSVKIRPGPGREKVGFSTLRLSPRAGQRPHLFVIPNDAAPLLATNKVDRRLFDVSLLLEFDYDDAHRDNVPLIVTYAAGASAGRAAPLARAPRNITGAVVGEPLDSINGVAASAAKALAHELWSSIVAATRPAAAAARTAAPSEPIRKLWLDGLRKPSLDLSVPQIGAPLLWDLGYEGDGILMGVLDTGIDETHPDLIDKVIVSRNFTAVPDVDDVGHGTHVASIIAGSGAAQGGRYRGVAPGVQLLSGKVCENEFYCPESSIIAGAQWAVMEEGARVVNVSIGSYDQPGPDPLEEAVTTLSADYGALFVVSAGNTGPGPQTIESPGSVPAALTVGAADRDEQVAWFSSRGFAVNGQTLKPDLLAPGVGIVAAHAEGTVLGVPLGEWYVALSGTSMAAPHAAGAAALLMQAHPEWNALDVKSALMGSAHFNPSLSALDQGAGFLDVAAALDTSIMPDTPSLGLGVARWPHDDGEVLEREVTFRNLGPAVELVLEIDVLGPNGSRPSPETFTLSPSILSLPAGGMAAATITVNTSVPGPEGVYGGRLIASDGVARTVTIPLAFGREIESYDLTVRNLDRAGAPTSDWIGSFFSVDSPTSFSDYLPWRPDGQDVTVRLPAGTYALSSTIYDAEAIEPPTLVVAPNQRLGANRLLVFDARAGLPVDITPPSPHGERAETLLSWMLPTASGPFTSANILLGAFAKPSPLYYSAVVPPAAPELSSLLTAHWLDSSSSRHTYYAGGWTKRGALPTGNKVMNLRRAAVVHARYAASLRATPLINELYVAGGTPENPVGTMVGMPVPLPYERTEYYYSESEAVRWGKELWMHNEEYTRGMILRDLAAPYRAGRSYTSVWNTPLFSPVLAEASPLPFPWAYREDNTLKITLPLYGDRAGHAGSLAGDATMALYRDGELIAEADMLEAWFDVPSGPASYRLEVDYEQATFELTPRQRAVWEFDSAPAEENARLPLLTFRFSPELNEQGRAPRGRHFCLPFSVDQYGSERAPRISQPLLEVSYDDGKSWARVPVSAEGEQWSAHLDHPRRAEYVSFRAFARDRRGNSVEQALIRAYALGGRH